VAQDQFDAGPAVPAGGSLLPGDLVFFGSGPTGVSHVGLYIGGGLMIDAPHTGAFVRVEATPTVVGAPFGSDIYVGATRPGSTLEP
jgi:cell wall-associated NlpC family hydrolase